MSQESSEERRPGGVTLLVVLGLISGIVGIVGGIWVIVDRDDPQLIRESGLTPDGLLAAGIAAIVVGVIGVLVALALGQGSRLARLLFGLWAVLNMAGGLYALVALHGEQQLSGAWSVGIGFVVLFLLFGSERDREFFLQ